MTTSPPPLHAFIRIVRFACLVAIFAPAPSFAQIPAGFVTTSDVGGVNDSLSANDLTQLGSDDSDPERFRFFWSWDSTTDWASPSLTGEACAHFDSNGNGNIDFVVCATITNDFTSVVQTGSTYVFECSDQKNDRCTLPAAVTPLPGDIETGVIGAGTPSPSPPGNLITQTDPYPNLDPDQDHPNDSTLAVTIARSLLPAGAELVNVCSYPSAENGGNNNFFDCVLTPVSVITGTIQLSSTTTMITGAGQVVPYSYLVSNTGNVTLTGIVVSDDQVSPVTCPASTLAQATSMTCSGTHTVTGTEFAAGGLFTNTATMDSDQNVTATDTLSICIGACAPNKCDAGKMKCVSKKQACLLKAYATAVAKGEPIDAAALQRCRDAFDGGAAGPAKGCIGKLEAKQDPSKPETVCTVTGDVATLEQIIDDFLLDSTSQILTPP
jgi:uncharacterized repeat protein (TIGR01451 family)